MSICDLSTCENIWKMCSVYYNDNLRTRFHDEWLTIFQNMIAQAIGKSSYTVVYSALPLIEPIRFFNDTVYISLPLLALLVNETPEIRTHRDKFIKNFDVFNETDIQQQNNNEDIRDTQTAFQIRRIASGANTHSRLENCLLTRQSICQRLILLRLGFAVAHFQQHYLKNIPYNEHPRDKFHIASPTESYKDDNDNSSSCSQSSNSSSITE